MSHVPFAASTLARRQHGVISAQQLIDADISAYRRRALVRAGTLEELHSGVFRFTAADDSFEQRCAAACIANPDIVISGPSAGRLLNLRRMPGGPVHVMIRARAVELDGVIVHRTNALADEDVVSRPDGVRVLATHRLVFDLARFLDDDDFESVIEQLLDRTMTDIPSLFGVGRRLRRPGRDGSVRFGRVLAHRPIWAKPKDSHLEVRLLSALSGRGVGLVPQLEVELPDGSVVHLDGGDRVRRFGVEVDHESWHGGRVDQRYDKWRDRQLARIDWVVPRVTDVELTRNFHAAVRELAEIYAGRQVA